MRAERDRIIVKYYDAVEAYSKAVSRLIGLRGSEFERAYQEADRLRKHSEECRTELEQSA